jgi:hypothetical protein
MRIVLDDLFKPNEKQFYTRVTKVPDWEKKIEAIIQDHEDELNQKPPAKATVATEGSQASASINTGPSVEMEDPGQPFGTLGLAGTEPADPDDPDNLDNTFADEYDQFLYRTIGQMARQDFIKNYASRQGDKGPKNYLIKTGKFGNLHDVMTMVTTKCFPSGDKDATEWKLLLSTILMTLSTALHGLLNPDFIGRVAVKDRKYFLGQHGYGFGKATAEGKAPRQTQIAKFIKAVITLPKEDSKYPLPNYVALRLNHMVSEAKGTFHVTAPPPPSKRKSLSVTSSPATTPKKKLRRKTSFSGAESIPIPIAVDKTPENSDDDDVPINTKKTADGEKGASV